MFFWIWFNSVFWLVLLGGFGGGGLDIDVCFVCGGGGVFLGRGGGYLGGGDVIEWNWIVGRVVLFIDNCFFLDLRIKLGKINCNLEGMIYF